LQVIDKTATAMGGRLLKRWLALPLKNTDKIRSRHEVVSHLVEHQSFLQKLQNAFKQIGDLERLVSKIATGKVNPREVIQLKNSLAAMIPIKAMATDAKNESLQNLGKKI